VPPFRHGGTSCAVARDHYASSMADIQKRGSYVPRSTRERQAYSAVRLGGISGGLFVVSAVLAVVGVIGWIVPIILAAVTGFAAWRFSRATGR
jgi:Flp pilus assembly protein TadB